MTNHKASLIVGHASHLAEILPYFNCGSLVATPATIMKDAIKIRIESAGPDVGLIAFRRENQ